MLNKVEVRNVQGAMLSLPLGDTSSGLIVKDIQGLGPVKATIVSSSFATQDGEQYQSSRREKRNIVITLELPPHSTSVWARRSNLYRWFMSKSMVDLKFYMDEGLVVDISGRVESMDPSIFTKEPGVDISILCFDPDFIDPTPVVVSTTTTQGTFEKPVPYSGTVETGIKFTFSLNRALSEFALYHRVPDGSIRTLEFAASLLSGDVLTIVTVPGSKEATLTRSGVTSSILYGVSPQSNWISLEPGDNTVRILDSGALIPYTVEYLNRYGGL